MKSIQDIRLNTVGQLNNASNVKYRGSTYKLPSQTQDVVSFKAGNALFKKHEVPEDQLRSFLEIQSKYNSSELVFRNPLKQDQLGAMKSSPVIATQGVGLNDYELLNKEKYDRINNIYSNLLNSPNFFESLKYDPKTEELVRVMSDENIKEKIAPLKHILDDIIPEILNSKKVVVTDITNLNKLLSDDVIKDLVLDKLEAEENTHDHDHDEHVDHDHHCHGDCKEDHDDDCDEEYNLLTPAEEKFNSAMEILNKVDENYDITLASKVPCKYRDPLGKDQKEHGTPDSYYNNKYKGIRHIPKNYFEAKYLQNHANELGYDPDNTVIVTPKKAASNLIQTLKVMNKDYLYMEDWLYDYCLGDQKAKDKVLDNISKVSDPKAKENLKTFASSIDNYQNNFVKLYDIKNPQNNAKLNESQATKDYNKVNAMSNLSQGYFLSAGEDATEWVKTAVLITLFVEGSEKLTEATGLKAIDNIRGLVASCWDDLTDASKTYLANIQQHGPDKAKEILQNAVSVSLAVHLPTILMPIGENTGLATNFAFRQAAAGSVYYEVAQNIVEHYSKFEEMLAKGIKELPEDIKDDPVKVQEYKLKKTMEAFSAHSVNRGQFYGLAASWPFPLLVKPLMHALVPVGGKSIVVTAQSMLECLIANLYLLTDSSMWNNFQNNLKNSFVEGKGKDITPEQFRELRKNGITKALDSSTGHYVLEKGIVASNHVPKGAVSKVKETAGSILKFVSEKAGTPISKLIASYLDKKYDKMSEEDRKNIKTCGCKGGDH